MSNAIIQLPIMGLFKYTYLFVVKVIKANNTSNHHEIHS